MLRITVVLLVLFPSYFTQADTITIGGKKFTEQSILAEIMAQKIEHDTEHQVTRRFHLGATMIALEALRSGNIDIYPEYTGTAWAAILKQPIIRDADEIYRKLQPLSLDVLGIMWGKPFGFNNTYALAVRQDDARFRTVKKISQLGDTWNHFSMGVNHDFLARKDGLPGLLTFYGVQQNSQQVTGLDVGLLYQSVRDGHIDMIAAYSTDGRIPAFGLKLLEDDKYYFPPYYAAPIFKESFAKQYPDVIKSLAQLHNVISDTAMQKMNYLVDEKQQDVAVVAQDFLFEHGLIDATSTPKAETAVFSQWGMLWGYFVDHSLLVLISMGLALSLALPLGLLLTRCEKVAAMVFYLASVIQTIPSIALLGFLIPVFGIGFKPAVFALFLYSVLPILRNTFVGIGQVDAYLIEATRGLGLTEWQIMRHVKIPLAMPMIMAGIRTSTVINIGTATVAALIGAGGFGEPILRGVNSVDSHMIMMGAVPAALMAIIFDKALQYYEEKWRDYLS